MTENAKVSLRPHEGVSENSKISAVSAWPKSRKLWSNFKENFLGTGIPHGTFGEWKTKIEENSNKILEGYNNWHPNDKDSNHGKV